jgi:hypothetical protein
METCKIEANHILAIYNNDLPEMSDADLLLLADKSGVISQRTANMTPDCAFIPFLLS